MGKIRQVLNKEFELVRYEHNTTKLRISVKLWHIILIALLVVLA